MSLQPRISLCMIVKNEERHLPRCLTSVHDLVDEIILVDTGSTDKTVEIARSFGAQVHFFPWRNDFAAARNESLLHATGDWVFWMDADESMNCCASEDCLRRAAASPGFDAYMTPIRSFTEGGKFDFHYAVRLFRRYPGIQFEGKVHEQVDYSLRRFKAKTAYAPFVIEHYGYAIDKEHMEHKLLRNLELLRKQTEEDRDNPFVHYYLGLTYIGLNREKNSFEALERALECNPSTPNLKCLILNLLTFHHLSREAHARAEETARESLVIVPRQNTAKLLLGIAFYNQGKYREALACLLPAYQFLRTPVERRKTQISQEHSYSEDQVLRAIAMSHARIGEFAPAIAFFHRYLEVSEGDAELHRVMGTCFTNVQDFQRALQHFSRAEGLGIEPHALAQPLAYIHMKLGNMKEAGERLLTAPKDAFEELQMCSLFQSFVQWHFESGAITHLCDVLERLSLGIPRQPLILDALGAAMIKAGNFDGAIKAYHALLAVDRHNKEIARRLAALYLEVGDTIAARRYLSYEKESDTP